MAIKPLLSSPVPLSIILPSIVLRTIEALSGLHAEDSRHVRVTAGPSLSSPVWL